jgi:hypothetical protein
MFGMVAVGEGTGTGVWWCWCAESAMCGVR